MHAATMDQRKDRWGTAIKGQESKRRATVARRKAPVQQCSVMRVQTP